MRSAELVVEYSNLDKPFKLIERVSGLGGTDYTTICRLTEDHACLLNEQGISWLYGEPVWSDHYRKIKQYKLEKSISDQQKELEKLNNG